MLKMSGVSKFRVPQNSVCQWQSTIICLVFDDLQTNVVRFYVYVGILSKYIVLFGMVEFKSVSQT